MAIWTIKTMERNRSDGGVTAVHWNVSETETAGESIYKASNHGASNFVPVPSSEDFIAYEDLTEAKVLEWVHADVDKDGIEAALTADITEQKTPATIKGLPWGEPT